jgi:hypothetical protein
MKSRTLETGMEIGSMSKHLVTLCLTSSCVAFALLGGNLSASEPLAESSASEWLADSAAGVRIWNPSPTEGESVKWLGVKDTASGSGVAIWSVDGQEREQAAGEWKEGRLDGDAVWQHCSGARYEGGWSNGLRHGAGVYTWPDGSRFCGQYLEGVRQEGAFYSSDGKPVNGIPPDAIRKLVFAAETAGLRARKAATAARRHPAR